MEARDIISIEDHRREEAKHDAEHFPESCKVQFKITAEQTVLWWSRAKAVGAWYEIANAKYPVMVREWLRDEIREDIGTELAEFNNDQVATMAYAVLKIGGDDAKQSLTEFMAEWMWRNPGLR